MNTTSPDTAVPARMHLRVRYPQLFDWVSMAIYVLLVYSWALGIYPLGRDYAAPELPAALAPVWQAVQAAFGSSFWSYQLFNAIVLYGCMIATFYLMRLGHQGPWWLGTLAAVLFMANPVHTESVANLCGMIDLLPCFLALVALAVYMRTVRSGQFRWLLLAVPLTVLAMLAAPENAGLALVCALFEAVCASDPVRKRIMRLAPVLLAVLGASLPHGKAMFAHGGNVAAMFGPLHLILYPIGFLPITARYIQEIPLLGWCMAVPVVALIALIYWRARRPMILFGLLAMPAVRVFGGGRPFEPVHLIGGGQLLLANAFFAIALTALFHRIMDHPKWRRLTVSGTSLLCLIFMVVQVHALVQWRSAGNLLRDFHAQLRMMNGEASGPVSGEALLISPDIHYVEGAPLCLSSSLMIGDQNVPYRPDLPTFSGGVFAAPKINIFRRKGVHVKSNIEDDRVVAVVEGATHFDAVPLENCWKWNVEQGSVGPLKIWAELPEAGPHLLVFPGQFPWPSSEP
ncbi:MAG: hypothetical protein ACOX5J_11005 [Candidatus Hydrogenedentales bacterium]|jgi:hypothetical protein